MPKIEKRLKQRRTHWADVIYAYRYLLQISFMCTS